MTSEVQISALEMAPGNAAAVRRRKLRLAIYTILALAILYFVGRSFITSFRQIHWDQVQVNFLILFAGAVCLCVQRMTNGVVWNVILESFGTSVPYVRIIGVAATSILGGYLPGKMAGAAGAVLMLVKLGVRLPVALVGLFLVTTLTVLVGLTMALPLALLCGAGIQSRWAWLLALCIVLPAMACLHPKVFIRLCNDVLRRLGREPITHAMASGPYVRAIAFSAVRYVILGVSVWLAGRSIVSLEAAHFPLVLATAVFMSIGSLLAGFTPAGLGVQEGIGLVFLGPVLGPDEAVLVTLMFRVIRTLADLTTGAVGLWLMRWGTPTGAPLIASRGDG